MPSPPALRGLPALETPRLLLRPPQAADFESWCAFMADAEATRHIGGVQTPDQVWRGMLSLAGAWALQGFSMFSIIEKVSGKWIGRAGPLYPRGWPAREVGWGIVRSHWGRGLAFEAACASMDFVVDTLGWEDIAHFIPPENEPSRILAQRLGSRMRGAARLPPPLDEIPVDLWAQTADDWRRRRK